MNNSSTPFHKYFINPYNVPDPLGGSRGITVKKNDKAVIRELKFQEREAENNPS